MGEAEINESSRTTMEKTPEKVLPIQNPRRAFLKSFLGVLGVFGLGAWFYGAYRYLSPGAGRESLVEVPLSEIPVGGVYYFQCGGSPGILFREEGSFRAFSLVCTHLACTVAWKPDRNEFYCPCHDGFFDADGKVLSGPPPAPLERWKVEVKGDQVVIGAA